MSSPLAVPIVRAPWPLAALAGVLVIVTTTLGACASAKSMGRGGTFASASQLTYAQVQSIQPGLSATQVRDSFGEPSKVSRGADGRVTRLEYAALDAKKTRARLVLDFDGREALVTKTYTGEIVRP